VCFQLSSVLGDLLFSILLATILSLCVEIPFIRLFKYATIKLGSKYGSLVLKVSYNLIMHQGQFPHSKSAIAHTLKKGEVEPVT